MSVEAICWALNLAPVPAGRGGQPSTACKFVLIGLASHAGPDGPGVFRRWPRWSATPGWRNGRYAPAWTGWRLGVIRPCDPDFAAERIERAGRRPMGRDLDLNLIRATT